MNPRMRPSRRRSVTDDFERETKLVVLNFMGLVPASCPATAEVCDTLGVDVSSDNDDNIPLPAQSAVPCGNCDLQPVPELSSEEDCGMVTRSIQNGTVNGQHCSELLATKGADGAEVVVSAWDEGASDSLCEMNSTEKLHVDSHLHQTSTAVSSSQQVVQPSRNSAIPAQSALLQPPVIPASSRTPSPCGSASPALLERQSSSRSTTSSRSRSSGTRNASINVQVADLETLVRTHALPPLVIPLRDEISHEMEVLGQERHDDDDAQEAAHSPETEVADMLRTIGDRVNEHFDEVLLEAVAAVLPPQAADQDIPYATLQTVTQSLIEQVHPGWSQVAMVLLFSQRVAFRMLLQGHSRIGNLADNTTRFIEDHIADFIISNGGWQSILDMEVSELLAESSNEAQSSADDVDDHVHPRATVDSHHQTPSQVHSQSDAAKPTAADAGREFVPDCSSVPSLSHDVSDVDTDVRQSGVDVGCDADIFLYVALCGAVVVMASAFYTQLMKK